ncbi:hypothetical protein F5Y10DRAFT_289320 [Nemania abortiva]|nr:hypothetical protein F5Y10DRAFT_289320 [Nemania abortiva]
MASFALLRVAPLISATSYVTFFFAEDTFIRPLVHTATSPSESQLRRHANRILPGLYAFTRRGLPFVFITYPISIATAVTNIVQSDSGVTFARDGAPQARAAAVFYLAGLIFSTLHLLFGPAAMAHLDHLGADKGLDSDPRADNTASIVAWLKINTIRGLVADIPSWICYLAAFLSATS